MNPKTTFKLLRPDRVWHPQIGGQFGNRNAFKTGAHVAEVRDWRRRVATWRRKVREVLASVEEGR